MKAWSNRLELFREVTDRIRQACDAVINLTTSGYEIAGGNVIEKCLAPVILNNHSLRKSRRFLHH